MSHTSVTDHVCVLGSTLVADAMSRGLALLGKKVCRIPCQECGAVVLNFSQHGRRLFFEEFSKTRNWNRKIIGFPCDPKDKKGVFPTPWDDTDDFHLDGDVTAGFAKLIDIIEPSISCLVNHLKTRSDDLSANGSTYDKMHCLEAAWASNLINGPLEEFRHGAKMDFANTWLAPRYTMLRTGNEEKARCSHCPPKSGICPLIHFNEIKNRFLQGKHAEILYGNFGTRFVEDMDQLSCKESCVFHPRLQKFDPAPLRPLIRRLMDYATRLRVLAGKLLEVKSEPGPSLDGQEEIKYRVLVVEDHYEYWKPIFHILHDDLFQRHHFYVDFISSSDGVDLDESFSGETKTSIYKVIPDCDMIILDVMIGNEPKGMEILNRVRKVFPTLPIVIASTSHDTEIFDNLKEANAFIYKKSIDINRTVTLLARLLREGYSRRNQSLPHPFFDANITGGVKEHVLNFTNWTIKHLDGFHGVDNHFFRYFNNHGGRHMIALMAILEKLLRPFLLVKSGEVGDLGLDSELEDVALALYLAVLTHEFGMFPMGTTSTRFGKALAYPKPGQTSSFLIEDFQKREFTTPDVFKIIKHDAEKSKTKTQFDEIMKVVRKFHGTRSMMMLLNKKLQYPEFTGILNRILSHVRPKEQSGPYDLLRARVAAIIGYHNRFLSLKKDEFLTKCLGADQTKIVNEISNTSVGTIVTKENIEKCLCYIASSISTIEDEAKRSKEPDRLRKICALFRFADALEIDYSRAIPSYLGYPTNDFPWNVKGYHEDLKRHVVNRIDVDCGVVKIVFNIQSNVFTGLGGYYERLIENIVDQNTKSVFYTIYCKRSVPSISDKNLLKRAESELGKYLEILLRSYCCDPGRNSVKWKNRNCLRKNFIVAVLCGLVVLELLDEYQAIRDVGLQEHIKFGELGFAEHPADDFELLEQMRGQYRS